MFLTSIFFLALMVLALLLPIIRNAHPLRSLVAWIIGCSVLVAPLLPGYFCSLRCCSLEQSDGSRFASPTSRFASPNHSDACSKRSLVAWIIECPVLVAPLLPGYFCSLRYCSLEQLDGYSLRSSLEPFAFLFDAYCFHSTDHWHARSLRSFLALDYWTLVVWISLFFFASILGQSSHSISKWDLTNLGGGLWPPFYYRVAPLLFFATMALVETLYSIIIKSMLRDLQPKLH